MAPPMRTDTIFPIASMTKPVTGVAILMMVEEGLVRLTDPVSRFVPEFTDPAVAVWQNGTRPRRGADAPEAYTIPAAREITIRDLMTHTSGLGSGGAGAIATQRVAPRRSTDTLKTYVAELGDAPLDFQPGTHWAYSGLNGIDTLGRVVEVVSGLTFDQFLAQRIFEPAGHGRHSNSSRPPPAPRAWSRCIAGHRTDSGRVDVPAWVDTKTLFSGWRRFSGRPPRTISSLPRCSSTGVSWAVSRLLGSRTVELMASNHVGELYAEGGTTGGRPGMGFGLDSAGSRERRRGAAVYVEWKFRVGRRLRHQLLGRPEGRPHCGADGANPGRHPAWRLCERGAAVDRRLSSTLIAALHARALVRP